jgi:membrane-bound metal-dependent hydrolase YbcI (DUF457 family)
MFIGHFGTGFAVKKAAPKLSLGTLFIAAQFIDLIWPFLLLFGIEKVAIDPGNTVVTPLNFTYYPFSHSLIGVLFWGLVLGVIYYFIKKDLKNSLWLAALVVSHWILDLLTHRPDLPLTPGVEVKLGFGLWNSLWGTIFVEGLLFAGGVYVYIKVTKAKNKVGSITFWALIVFLLLIYISNLFGPPPPAAEPIAILGMAQWLLVAWGYWIDRNRVYVRE